jgi:starvation-inducible DNA-binding protein
MPDYIEKNHQKQVVEELRHILANTFALYFKTHAYHWNVEGANFDSLHTLFGTQYTEMWAATDIIAERIRSLGDYAPLNLEDLMKHTDIKPAKKMIPAIEMVKDLAKDHETLSQHLATAIGIAGEVGDDVTADLLIARLNIHDKTAWMLNATAK